MPTRTVLAVCAALHFAAASVRSQDLPRIDAACAAAEAEGSPPLLLVAVLPERPALVRRASFAEGDHAVPLGDLSILPLQRAIETWAAAAGQSLDEVLAATGAPALDQAPEPVRRWTWRQILDREARGALPAYRFLGPGEAPRSPAEILGTHALPGSAWAPRNDLPIAALVLALEHRAGQGFEAWLAGAATRAGMPGLRLGGPEFPLFERRDGETRALGAQPRAEIEAGFGLRATAADLASLLGWLAEAPAERLRLGGERSFRGRPQTSRRLVGTRFGAACQIEVLGEGQAAWCLWSAVRGSDERFAILRDALLEDLLGPAAADGEDDDPLWNSAVGLGGGAGGRFVSKPLELPAAGRMRARIEHLGRASDLELDLGPRLGEIRVEGQERVDVLRVATLGVEGELRLDAETILSIDLRVDGEDLAGHAIARSGERFLLPYRLRFEPLPDGEPAAEPLADRPSLRRPFPTAMAAVERELAEVFAATDTARVVAVGRSDGATWDRASGNADPDRGLPMRREARVPLGTLTQELFAEAFAYLDATGRLDGIRTIEPLFGDEEPPFDRRLLRLAPWQLAAGGAPLPDYFRATRDALQLRPVDAVLRTHAFFLSRRGDGAPDAALARALLIRALETGSVIAPWPAFVSFELGAALGMPGLVDAAEAGRDLATLRLRGPDGGLRPAPRFELAVEGGAWARGADLARWLTGLVQEAAAWGTDRPAPWQWRYATGRSVPAYARSADRDDMTCRILLVPAMGLGIFVWGADGDRTWVGPAVESVLGAFWNLTREPSYGWTEPVRMQLPSDLGPAKSSTLLAGAPRGFRGDVPGLGEVAVHCAAEAGQVRVVVGGRELEVLEARTARRSLEIRCALPTELAPDRAEGAELRLAAVVRSAVLSGEIALVREGWFRLPYALTLPGPD
jgi:hypothetical protein